MTPSAQATKPLEEGGLPGSTMSALLRQGEQVGLLRYRLTPEQWEKMLSAPGHSLPLLASWADATEATLLLLEGESPVLVSTPVLQRRYLGASRRYVAAVMGERMSRDLWGVEAQFARSDTPLLDSGCWTVTWPLAPDPVPASGRPDPAWAELVPPDRSGVAGVLNLTRVEDGSVECGLFEAHRGIQARLRGLRPTQALGLVGRVSASGFVAHPLAFARAVEQACGLLPTPRERDIRLLLLEVERLSLHLYDLARTAREAGAGLMGEQCAMLRERLCRLCQKHGTSRRLTDTIGVLPLESAVTEPVLLAQAVVDSLAPYLPRLTKLNRIYASRFAGVGVLSPEMAWQYALGGAVGRGSGRFVDLRRSEAGMRVDCLRAPVGHEGDALARNRVRLGEMRDSLALLRRLIASIGQSDGASPLPPTGEGLGVAEGARGDVWYWVRLDENGNLADVQVRDPAVALLGALTPLLASVPAARVPLVLSSLGLSPAGAAL
ncbi:NADH-quinone oxidoreductase subunit D-related protein [Oecophyllibacter saccharovorans]|nr:hypothetical protein [Oecophyllibacter saccharovorans]